MNKEESEDRGEGKLHEELMEVTMPQERKTRVHAWNSICGQQNHVQLRLQPHLLFTLAVTILHGIPVPNPIHISPRKKRRWLSAVLHLAPILLP